MKMYKTKRILIPRDKMIMILRKKIHPSCFPPSVLRCLLSIF